MTSENQDFEMYAGESKVITITVNDAAGDPVDLSGATIKWAVKVNPDDAEATITKNSGEDGGIEILDQETKKGQLTITLAPADTEEKGGVSYCHEAEVTDSEENVSTATRGMMRVKKALVRDAGGGGE